VSLLLTSNGRVRLCTFIVFWVVFLGIIAAIGAIAEYL